MNDKFMFKLAQIRSSYTRKRFGTLNNKEKALADYETFCLELIKDYEKLEQENNQLKEQKKELRSWLEAIKTMYENEYKDVNTAEHYNSVLSKLNELENKSAENGKNVQ